MPQSPQNPWAVASVGDQSQAQAPAAAAPAATGTPKDPWAVASVGQLTDNPTTPTTSAPVDANGQPIVHYQAPGVTATVSAYKPTWIDRIENMFSDYRRTESGIGKYVPTYHPLKEGEGMQIFRPENIMTESEKKEHPMATAVGEFAGGMTSPENVGLMMATEGGSAAAPLLEGALEKLGLKGLSTVAKTVAPKLLSAGFSAQMLKGAYDKIPEIRRAWDKGDVSEVERLFTHAVLDGSLGLLLAKHTVKGGETPLGKETQYEKVQREVKAEDTADQRAVGGPPPVETPAPAAPAEEAEQETPTLRPTTTEIAGKEIPVTAAQAQTLEGEGPTFINRMARKLVTPGQAAAFQMERTKPEAQAAFLSSLSQSAEDKIAAYEAVREGQPTPDRISGTNIPGSYSDPDEIWAGMQKAAGPTWEKAREQSNKELAQWEQAKRDAVAAHKMGIDQHNSVVDQFNSSLSEGETPMERVTFDENDVPNMPERPVTFDELRDAVRTAKARAAGEGGISFEDQTKARQVELPKAEKALDKWFADRPDVVSEAEYDSAKKLHADSIRYQDMANYLRMSLAKGNLTGSMIRGLEAKVNGIAIKEQGQKGLGAFRRLVGDDVYSNIQKVASLFDPVEKTGLLGKAQSWGQYTFEYVVGGALGAMLHATTGFVGGVAAKVASEVFMNKLLYDPEFGSTFGKVVDAVKSAAQTGRQIPNDLMSKLLGGVKDVYDKIMSSETGTAGAAVTQRKAGSPIPPKFGRAGLGRPQVAEGATSPRESLATNTDLHQTIADQHNSFSGFTYNPEEGFVRDKPVFSVGGKYADTERVVPEERLTPEHIRDYINDPQIQEILKNDPTASIGGYQYKGHPHLEVSNLVHDRAAAIEAGKRLNQESIYDHEHRTLIPTGGTAADEAAATSQFDALKQKYGTTSDPLKAGFILPQGDMIPLVGEHDHMLGGKTTENTRESFIKDTGAIRTRYRMSKAGEEQVFSLPPEIDEQQALQIQRAAGKIGQFGQIVLETVDGKNHKIVETPTGRTARRALESLVKIKPEAEEPEVVTPNASGESAASQEAINREASNKAQGVKTYRVDTRTGNVVPVLGVDAVDATAKPYEKIVQVKGDQVTELDSGRGARPLDEAKLLKQTTASDAVKQTTVSPKGSTVGLMQNPLKVPKGETGTASTHDVAMALNKFTQTYLKPLELGEASPDKQVERAKRIMEDEAKYQLAQNNAGTTWYTEQMDEHDDIARQMRPDTLGSDSTVKTDLAGDIPVKMGLFKMAEAILSSGQKPYRNFTSTLEAWDYYVENGRFSRTNPETGKSWGPRGIVAYGNAFDMLNQLVEDKGEAGALQWLLSEHPVKELREMNKYVSGKQDSMRPGVMILGEKRGPFSMNLHKLETAFTADMWISRTWNRWMGTIEPNEIEDDKNALATDSPRSQKERQLMKQSFAETAEKMGLTTSSLQAVLWYYEQALYTAHGSPKESWSFSDAAKRAQAEEKERSSESFNPEEFAFSE